MHLRPKKSCEYSGQNLQKFKARPAQSQGGRWAPACGRCGRTHRGKCRDGQSSCFKCGQEGHFIRELSNNKLDGGNSINRAQYSLFDPPHRAAPRGGTSGVGRGWGKPSLSNHSRQEQENSPNIIKEMIKVFIFYAYDLFDPGEILSFVTPYIENQFEIIHEKHSEHFYVSTPVGESILAERVYRDCLVSINHKNTMSDLVELDMIDFYVILGMD